MKRGGNRRDRIIGYLRERDGVITSDDGRGLTAAIAAEVGYDDLPTLNGMLARLERDGVIEREIRGKRTYRISLVEDGRAAARHPDSRRDRAVRAITEPAPSVAELKRTLASLEARVAELEARASAGPKKRRRWRAS
jgi:DNA-binding MarR family transcriptional regulator